jgi:epoxyqueuosine reductase
MQPEQVKTLARECGFELAGIATAVPAPEATYYGQWIADGLAGEMRYLTDRRAGLRNDPRHLLPSARSMLCVG